MKKPDINLLKSLYFSEPTRKLTLPKGEYLMRQGERNERLYMIAEGQLIGYLTSEGGDLFEVFRAEKDMFVGVYSFFSGTYQSYATLQAEEQTTLYYITTAEIPQETAEEGTFAAYFMPIIVNELSTRQLLAQRVAHEKEEALKKLLQTEKMAMLGQLAAGLAHELNNAVGVLQGKTVWLAQEISQYLHEKDQHGMYRFFEDGLEKGQFLSSADVRLRKKVLEKQFGIPDDMAKKVAKIGFTDQEVQQLLPSILSYGDRMMYYWEIGTAFHDMLVAAKHAVHVVKSVKQLGVAQTDRCEVDVHDTIQEALALLQSVLRRVKLIQDLKASATVFASSGELVQIWLNIVKNACESMLQAEVADPILQIVSGCNEAFIYVKIIDNGPGISPALIDKIFQPNVTTKKGGLSFGLGLGLAIVQRLIDGYKGSIQVESRPGYTCFEVRLPLNEANS
jgi:signal transduction histidine kinase